MWLNTTSLKLPIVPSGALVWQPLRFSVVLSEDHRVTLKYRYPQSSVRKQLVRHVIDSSGWRHTRRVTFPGGARHAAANQHIVSGAPPFAVPRLAPTTRSALPPLAPTLTNKLLDV